MKIIILEITLFSPFPFPSPLHRLQGPDEHYVNRDDDEDKPSWALFDNYYNDDDYDDYDDQYDHDEYDDQTWMALLRSTSGIARDCSTVPKEVIIRLM